MSEEQIKLLCKLMIENSPRPFTDFEREALKQAVDSSRNWDELLVKVIVLLQLG